MKYLVVGIIDASTSIEVEASSPEEAYEKAESRLSLPSLCWQCGKEVNIGDIIEIRVDDLETGETVYTDRPDTAEKKSAGIG